jgi:hypothetical protein
VIGFRHTSTCNCGCQFVVGLDGVVVQDSDTPKLAALGLAYVRFWVPSVFFGCGASASGAGRGYTLTRGWDCASCPTRPRVSPVASAIWA